NCNAVEGVDDLNLWSKQGHNINIYPWDGICHIFGNGLNMHGNKITNTGTYYWSCPGTNFKAWVQGTQVNAIDYHYGQNWVESDQDTAFFMCPVFLPNGAVVTGAVVYGNISDESWELQRMEINSTTTASLALAYFNTEDTSISNATINNNLYSYAILTSGIDDTDVIYGARIRYTL
ncbi:unnamed protein product, partial [marine sediment metagenome]